MFISQCFKGIFELLNHPEKIYLKRFEKFKNVCLKSPILIIYVVGIELTIVYLCINDYVLF